MAKDTITLRDVYDIANRLEEKIDERQSKIEERISFLESNWNKALGVLSIISIFFSAVATYIWNKIMKGSS